MKIRILFILLCFVIYLNLNAQRWIRPFENYYTTVASLDIYFDSIVQTGDSTLFNEGSEYSNYLKWKHDFGGAVSPHGDFHILSQQEYSGAQSSNNAPPSNARFTDPWREIGPDQNYDPGIYAGIGPTEFLVFHPNTQDLMLCGSLRGGIFVTYDGGINWVNAGTDNLDGRTGASSATFDYNSAFNWYFTTAGQFPNGSDPTEVGLLGGVYRTLNSGMLYEKIWDPNPYPNNDIPFRDATVLRKIEADQNYPGTDLWLGTNDGFYHTTNCNDPNPLNVHWTNVLPGDWDVTDFELRPGTSGPQTIFAAVYDGVSRSIQYSSDHGQTWAALQGTPAAITTLGHYSGNVTLEVCPADPNLLYVFVAKPSANSHLFVFNINLNSWYDFQGSQSFDGSFSSGHCFGVDPLNNSVVFLPNGVSFVEVDCNFNSNTYLVNNSNSPTLSHADCEHITFNPFNNNELWMCHHGGLAVYSNKFILSSFTDRSSGLGVAIINQMSTSQSSPDYVLCGLDHDWSQLTATPWDPTWNPSWNSYFQRDGQKPLIDPTDANNMWITGQGSLANAWESRTNLNSVFQSLPSAIPNTNSYSDFATFGALNPRFPNKFYRIARDVSSFSANHCDEIFLSNDRGQTYSAISNFNNFIPTTLNIPNLLYEVLSLHISETNPNYLIAVVKCFPANNAPTFNVLCRTKFAAQNSQQIINSWEVLPISRNDPTEITNVNFDLNNPEIVYVAFVNSTSTYSSATGGEVLFRYDYLSITLGNYYQSCSPSWCTDITYNLPNTTYGDFVLERGSDGGIYISTSLGVFFMNNKSISDQTYWQKIGPNLPNCRANAIEINYKINRIRVGTNGRGVWEHPLVCPTDFDLVENSNYISTQFIEVQNDINSTSIINSGIQVTYRAGNEIILSPGFIATAGSDFDAYIHPCDYGIPNSFRSIPINPFAANENNSSFENSFFKIFPNPNSGSFSIYFEENFVGSENVEISVVDLTGRMVYYNLKSTSELSASPLTVMGLSNGIYFVKIKSETYQGCQKIIVNN